MSSAVGALGVLEVARVQPCVARVAPQLVTVGALGELLEDLGPRTPSGDRHAEAGVDVGRVPVEATLPVRVDGLLRGVVAALTPVEAPAAGDELDVHAAVAAVHLALPLAVGLVHGLGPLPGGACLVAAAELAEHVAVVAPGLVVRATGVGHRLVHRQGLRDTAHLSDLAPPLAVGRVEGEGVHVAVARQVEVTAEQRVTQVAPGLIVEGVRVQAGQHPADGRVLAILAPDLLAELRVGEVGDRAGANAGPDPGPDPIAIAAATAASTGEGRDAEHHHGNQGHTLHRRLLPRVARTSYRWRPSRPTRCRRGPWTGPGARRCTPHRGCPGR